LNTQCLPTMCALHGSCDDSSGVASCVCDSGYYACDFACFASTSNDTCDTTCAATNPCLNGATCNDDGGRISCACATGFAGARCDQCAAGFHLDGTACVANQHCLPGLCSPNGSCDDTTGIVICNCDPTYFVCGYECLANGTACTQ